MRYTRNVGPVPLPPRLGPRGIPLRAYSGLNWEGMTSLSRGSELAIGEVLLIQCYRHLDLAADEDIDLVLSS